MGIGESDTGDESKLVGLLITSGDTITLLTPHGRYQMHKGKLQSVERVENYYSAINDEFAGMKKLARAGHACEYKLQIFSKD